MFNCGIPGDVEQEKFDLKPPDLSLTHPQFIPLQLTGEPGGFEHDRIKRKRDREAESLFKMCFL